MQNDMANAGNFRYKSLFVNGELVSLLEGFVDIYGKIVKSDVRLENNEKIKTQLSCACALKLFRQAKN